MNPDNLKRVTILLISIVAQKNTYIPLETIITPITIQPQRTFYFTFPTKYKTGFFSRTRALYPGTKLYGDLNRNYLKLLFLRK